MKKIILLSIVSFLTLISCGPSEAEKVVKEKGENDSLAEVAKANYKAYDMQTTQMSFDTVAKKTKPVIQYQKVPVFYATDRNKSGSSYGSIRNEKSDYKIGIVSVTIPIKHESGEVEEPGMLASLIVKHFGENYYRARYFDIKSTAEMTEAEYYSELKQVVKSSDEKDAFIFIHGYNNSFEDAAKRTAQIAYDIGFKGAPIMYSWPSENKLLGYLADENDVQWSKPHLIAFLKKILDNSNAKKIHIIAHSMGNRLLTDALQSFNQDKRIEIFNQIILAAPDIDASIFKTQIAPNILSPCTRVTMYSSTKDKALAESKRVHGGYLRIGETISVIPGISTIDASNLKVEDFFDHAYFAQAKPILDDIKALFNYNLDPKSRKLVQFSGPYWVLKQ